MSRIDYSLWNDDDEIRNFGSAAKAVTNSYQTSLELAVPREMKRLALDIVVRAIGGDSQIDILPEHSLLPGSDPNSYWAKGCRLAQENIVDESNVEYDALATTYHFKNISAGYARRLVFDVSTTPYFRFQIKSDVGGATVHVYASVATQEG